MRDQITQQQILAWTDAYRVGAEQLGLGWPQAPGDVTEEELLAWADRSLDSYEVDD